MKPPSRFWRSREAAWKAFAERVGGVHVDPERWTRGQRLLVPHPPWTIVLDVEFNAAVKAESTRLRAPFINPNRFCFKVRRRSVFSGMGSLVGMPACETGDNEFDRAFIVTGTSAEKVFALFASDRLRGLLEALPGVHLSVRESTRAFETDPDEPTDELCALAPGVVKDPDRLGLLVGVIAETLDQLRRIGVTPGTAPSPTRCPCCDHLLVHQTLCPECGKPVTV